MIDFKNLPQVAGNILKARIGHRVPLKVTQYVTYRCNLACGFCGRRYLKTSEMATEQIKKCMDEFKKMGTIFWSFNGGEPLLRPDIGELINYSQKLGFKCSIMTNGTLIPEKIEQLKGLDLVEVSLDGPEEINDAIRGQGTFKKVIKAIEILRANNILVCIDSVINSTNLDYLDELWKISEKYGTQLEFQPVIIHSGDQEKKAAQYFPAKEKFLVAINWLIAQKRQGRKINNSFSYLEQLKSYPDLPMSLDCWASYLFCVITPDGFVAPCAVMLDEQEKFKNGLEVSFEKAFYSLPDLKKCRRCFFSCYGEYNCALNSLTKTGLKFIKNKILGSGWFWQ
ncbi:MAG: radical SAM protein [Patescibacteria group bacterium]